MSPAEMFEALAKAWRDAAEDLGLRWVAPDRLASSGRRARDPGQLTERQASMPAMLERRSISLYDFGSTVLTHRPAAR